MGTENTKKYFNQQGMHRLLGVKLTQPTLGCEKKFHFISHVIHSLSHHKTMQTSDIIMSASCFSLHVKVIVHI